MILYHLISDQVWQNLIPLLTLRPDKVVHVRSSNNKWKTPTKRIQRAAKEIAPSWQPTWIDAPLDSDFPDMNEMRNHLHQLHERHPVSCINFTGGTKMGAIGAYQFAVEADRPAFYFDTDHRKFFAAAHQPLPSMRPLDEVIPAITVRAGLMAHGVDGAKLRFGNPTEPLMAFALAAVEARTRAPKQVSRWLNEMRSRLSNSPRAEPHWSHASSTALPYPEDISDLADAAIAAGLFRMDNGGRLYLQHPASESLMLLEGGWWELVCLDFFRSQQKFTDLQWSFRVEGDDTYGETDLIGFNRDTLKFEFFSCKVAAFLKPLEHLESLRRRTERYGGSQASSNLMVFQCPHERERIQIIEKCHRQRVVFHEGYPPKVVKK